jgi:peptidase S41-like protein
VALQAHGQGATSFQKDLDVVLQVFKKLPSYKVQMKGEKLKHFKATYEKLYASGPDSATNREVFEKVASLFFLLKDNHLSFYELPPVALTVGQLNDSIAIREYRSTAYFQRYPRLHLNIDSLENILVKRPVDSVEGLYYYDDYLKIGLYRTRIPSEYTGIVLASKLSHWDAGDIAIRLYEYAPNAFHAIYGHPVFKNLMLHNNEKFLNRSLANAYFHSSVSQSVYRKNPHDSDYVNIPRTAPGFVFKPLTPDIQYLRLGNFSNQQNAMNISKPFLASIRDSLTAPHLILDIRNNTGGAESVSDKFLKLIKSYSKQGKVYVLTNNGTYSRGEIFLLQLKGKRNVKTFGQTTNGTLAYGSNSGKTVRLPGGKYQIYITDMKNKGSYVLYENTGVTPEVWLDSNGDWIQKMVEWIRMHESK